MNNLFSFKNNLTSNLIGEIKKFTVSYLKLNHYLFIGDVYKGEWKNNKFNG